MKKIIFLLFAGLVTLMLVACGGEELNVRASFPTGNIELNGTSITFSVSLIDPDLLLPEHQITISIEGNNAVTPIVEDAWLRVPRTFTFEGLTPGTTYTVVVETDLPEEGNVRLASREFTTAEVGRAEDVPIMITNAEEFFDMANAENGTFFELANNINFEGAQAPVMFNANRRFTHHFNGAGFALQNLNQTADEHVSGAYISIFGFIRNGSIRNLVLDGITIDNRSNPGNTAVYAGILASRIDSIDAVIENITIKNSALLVRHNQRSTADGWTNVANNRSLFLGTVVGAAQGTIRDITIYDTQVEVTMSNLMQGLTAIAGVHIGGAIGLIEQNRGREFSNFDVNIDLEVNINSNRVPGQSRLNIGGVVGFHRGMDRHGEVALESAVVRGTVALNISMNDDSSAGAPWIAVGGFIGSVDAQQIMRDVVVMNDVSVTFASNSTNVLDGRLRIGSIIGWTLQHNNSFQRVVSFNQTSVLNASTTTSNYNFELMNTSRTINHSNISVRTLNSTLSFNSATVVSAFETLDGSITDFIASQWVLDILATIL